MANLTIARAGNAPRLGKMGRSRLARAVALGILIGGAVAAPAQAAQSVWTGANSDQWTDIGNWVVPPTSGSFVIIDAIAPHATSLDTVVDVGAMIVGDQAQGALTIGAGGELSVLDSQAGPPPYGAPLGLVIANARGSQGTVTVDGAGARLVAVENTLVGNGGTGTLSIANGGAAELGLNERYAETVVGFGYYGWGDSSAGLGHVTVDGAGSSLVYAGGMNVLNGTVDVTDGGQLVSIRRGVDGTVFWVDGIGFGLPASGEFPGLVGEAKVSVSGAGSAWSSANALNVGTGGPASLEVTDGGTASFKGYTVLGSQNQLYNQDGTATGLWSVGSGELTVSGAGSSFTVGADPDGGNGSLQVGYSGAGAARIDAGASASIAGLLIVGDGATGTLDIASGGTMAVAGSDANGVGLLVGNKAGTTGTVTVSGAGSKLSVDQSVQIGKEGDGTLQILDGATAELATHGSYSEVAIGSGYFYGMLGAGTGHVLVDGEGSTLTHAGGMNVVKGTLDISNGGQVVAVPDGVVPAWTDEVGADSGDNSNVGVATVTGAGSAWHSRNGLQIAYGGTGTLNVLDGATAEFGGFLTVGNRSRVFDETEHWTGAYVEGNGTLLVSGQDSSLTLDTSALGDGDLTVAAYGTGRVIATAGGEIDIAGKATVGDAAGTVGSVEVSGGGTMTVAGGDGTGLNIGNSAGSTGSVVVTGAGSTLTVGAGAQVGNSGTGTLSVLDGAHASIGMTQGLTEIVVGFGYYGWGVDVAQGRGSITVDGAGSQLEYGGGLNLLNGDLAITHGATLESLARGTEGGWIDMIGFGVPADPDPDHHFNGLYGDARVVVGGAGSEWDSINGLWIGSGGDGLLQVLDGGKASFTGYADLGLASYLYDSIGGSPVPDLAPQSGAGYLMVSGAGSRFSLSVAPGAPSWGLGVLSVGIGGEGGMMVADGGTASIAGGVKVGGQGTVLIGGVDLETGELALAGAGTLDTPSIALLDPSSSLLLHHTSTDAVLAAAISGTGYIEASAGTTRLTGDSSAFAGTTSIDGGATLAVSGKLSGAMPYVGEDGVGTLLVDGGGAVHVTGIADFGTTGFTLGMHDGSSGTATVTGAGSSLTVDAGTQIGGAGTGTLSVLGGGIANLGLTTAYAETVMGLGYYGWSAESGHGRGTLRVDGAGSTVNYSGGLNVLAGDVNVTGGGQLMGVARASEGGWLDLIGWGVPADPDPAHHFAGLRGTASVTVSGEGSAWKSLNGLDIGSGGDGILSVLAGADASFQGDAYLGGRSYLYSSFGGSKVPNLAPQTGTGTIRVSGAGSNLAIAAGLGADGLLVIGRYGGGSMEVASGATASVASTLAVGDNAAGTLSITGGGHMSVLGADASRFGGIVGGNQGATGAVTVSGAGSTLAFTGGLQVGNAGTGVLTVKDGGAVSAGLGTRFSETVLGVGNYGWATGAEYGTGTMTVTGAGSTFDYAGGLNVLSGAATVSAGGKVASQKRAVDGTAFWTDTIGFGVPANPDGSYAGLAGTGTMTVTGAGSSWSSVNGLNIGYGSNGALSVLDGAQVNFSAYAELGKLSYLYDAPDGAPIAGLAGRAGAGTLLVSGAGSSFALGALAGNTTWGTGVLELGNEGKGSVTVNNGGTVSAAGGIKVGAQGTFTIGGMQGGTLAAPGTVSSGITLIDPAATLVFNHSATAHDDTAYAFAQVISGNGHVDVAGGFTRLTGDSSGFTGETTIDTGATLSVNGSLGGDIAVDGRLQGTGTVGNVTVNGGGTLAPGNSPGTLHVDGDLVMQTGSIYAAEIDSDTGLADSIAVNGNVTISTGTVLSVSNLGTQPLTPGANLQLIQTTGATSTVQGQFDTVVGGSELLDFGVSYENGQIQVSAERSETTNFASVAGAGFGSLGIALDGIPDDSALTKLMFAQVTTAAAAAALVEDMAGTMHADLRRVMLEGSRYPRAAIGDRLQDDDATGGVAWARAMGGSASTDGSGGLPATTVDHSGVMVGYDTAIGASRLGVAIGTDKGSYAADGKDASANLYGRHVSLYGRSMVGGLRLGYGLAFGATDAKTERGFDIGTTSQHLYGKHEARTTQGFVDLGYRLDGGNSFRYVEPFLNLARVQVDDDATTETGSVAALEIASGDTSATFGTIGLRWNADMGGADFAGSIGWRHAFGFDGASATQAFVAGGPSFTMDSLPIDNAVIVDLGARFRMAEHARVWLGYNGMLSGSAHDHGLKLQFNLDL